MANASRRSAFLVVVSATALGIALLLLLGTVLLHVGSAWSLRQLPKVPAVVKVPTGGDPTEGSRLASILGCRGCHGQDLGGRANCFEKSGQYQLTCPNVTEARERYDDRALVLLLRHGRKSDGAMVDFMPWDMYAHLTDEDLSHILAFVRATPAIHKANLPASSYSWRVRWEMLRGRYPEQNELSDYDTTPLQGIVERGRYLTSIACPECHAPNLRGYPGDDAPSLVVAKAYSPEAFARLMREGLTIAGSESRTGLMSSVARDRFSLLKADEVAAIKLYLDQRSP
jgi:cytochrome c553